MDKESLENGNVEFSDPMAKEGIPASPSTLDESNLQMEGKIPPIEEWKACLEKFETLQKECLDYQDKFLRARADLDNLRKRLAREREDIRNQAITAVFSDIISVFDHFKMGMETAEKNAIATEVMEGFRMVFQQLKNCLEKNGIMALEPTNEIFDPHRHDAVSAVCDDNVPEGHVLSTIRTGYLFGKQLLRPATVVVSKGKAQKPEVTEAKNKEEKENISTPKTD